MLQISDSVGRDGQHAHGRPDQPVTVLVEDAADHARPRIGEHVVAEGGGPVGNRHPRAGIRHDAADQDQEREAEDDRQAGRDRQAEEQPGEDAQPERKCQYRPIEAGARGELRQARQLAGRELVLRDRKLLRHDVVGEGR